MWGPDGRRPFFSSDQDGVRNLYAQAADGTGTADAAPPQLIVIQHFDALLQRLVRGQD